MIFDNNHSFIQLPVITVHARSLVNVTVPVARWFDLLWKRGCVYIGK